MKRTKGTTSAVAALIIAIFLTAAVTTESAAGPLLTLPDNSKLDLSTTCPVCGMTVGGGLESAATYAYRNGKLTSFGGVAAAVFKDGHVVGFEGARCLFIYNTIPKRFGIDVGTIVHRYVTDFDAKALMDADKAIFVMGSPVKGFMGFDLIPFSTRQAAEQFMSAHGGKRVSDFKTIGGKDVRRELNPSQK
jgi:copper chaperone NosL